jgi:hypothetical protein
MKTALTVLALATVLVPSQLRAIASPTAPEKSAISTAIPASLGELTPEVQAFVTRGDVLCSTLRFKAAAREYSRAVELARRQGHLASGTTWRLANAHYNDRNFVAAAAALDQLATDASQVGDLGVEALALYNSAWLNGKAGRKLETVARVARLQGLLRSPYMPVAIRDHVSGLLSSWTDVVLAS